MDSKTRQNRPDVRLKQCEHKLRLAVEAGDTDAVAALTSKIEHLKRRIADRAQRQVLAICVSPDVYETISDAAAAQGITRKAYVERAIKVYLAVASCCRTDTPKLEVRA